MQVLPVLDLMGGIAVHARGGERAQYRPLRSRLCPERSPSHSEQCVSAPAHPHDTYLSSIARAFRAQLGLDTAYVADLDALRGYKPQWSAIDDLRSTGLSLWLDLGLETPLDAERAWRQLDRHTVGNGASDSHGLVNANGCGNSLIVALESWRDPTCLADLVAIGGAERLTFSLDLKNGVPLTVNRAWGDTTTAITERVANSGIRRVILLDLAEVGRSGGNWARGTLGPLVREFPEIEWYPGGGARSIDDLCELADLGCAGVLVGTALHDGTITADQLKAVR